MQLPGEQPFSNDLCGCGPVAALRRAAERLGLSPSGTGGVPPVCSMVRPISGIAVFSFVRRRLDAGLWRTPQPALVGRTGKCTLRARLITAQVTHARSA